MAKGEIPIGYIIALVLGVAVVAILGYWFLLVQGAGGTQMSDIECKNKAFMYCTMWSANGYDINTGTQTPSLSVINGGDMWFAKTGVSNNYAPGCMSFTLLQGAPTAMKSACMNNVLGGQ